jgi:hypothetical protein
VRAEDEETVRMGEFYVRLVDRSDPDSSSDLMNGKERIGPFAYARVAWAWLADLRRGVEDDFPDWNIGEYSDTVRDLEHAAAEHEFGDPNEDWPLAADGTGCIVGSTPGLGDREGDPDVTDPGYSYIVEAQA